jgi:Cysteine rich repeat
MLFSRTQALYMLSIEVLAGALALRSAPLAADQLPRTRAQGVCKADVDKFCSEVKPGGGRFSACLKLHEAEVSADCLAVVNKKWRLASNPADDRCVVYGSAAGTTVEWTMIVINDGTPCEISRDIAGTPATSVTVHSNPRKGSLSTDGPAIRYTPPTDFTGGDLFEVQWFGMPWGPYSPISFKTSLRATIEVIVRAK